MHWGRLNVVRVCEHAPVVLQRQPVKIVAQMYSHLRDQIVLSESFITEWLTLSD
jgi:hypothetical protein